MDLFKSGNPTLSEKAFKNTSYIDYTNSMTVRGTLNKFGFMFLMVMGTAYYSWKEFTQGGNVQPLIWGGAIGGFEWRWSSCLKKNGRLTWHHYMLCWKAFFWAQFQQLIMRPLLKECLTLS